METSNQTINLANLTIEQLNQLQSDIAIEIARRTNQSTTQRYSLRYSSYNARRYSRPWIALITSWPVGGRPELEFGGYCGDDGGGEVEITAKPGDIIRSGQKDSRGNSGCNDWYVARDNGELEQIDQPTARTLYSGR